MGYFISTRSFRVYTLQENLFHLLASDFFVWIFITRVNNFLRNIKVKEIYLRLLFVLYRIWFSSAVNAITRHVSVSRWAWLKFFRELTRVQSSSTRLRLPVLVYLHTGCSFASLPTITYASLMLEYIFKLPFPVSWKSPSIVSASSSRVELYVRFRISRSLVCIDRFIIRVSGYSIISISW